MQSWHIPSEKQRSHQSRSTTRESVSAICLQIVDVGLVGIIFIAPLFLGGRDALGKMVFIVLAGVTGVAWFVRQALLQERVGWTRSWAFPLAFASLALVAAQLIPLSWGLLQQLAPRNSALLTLWQGEASDPAQLGVWNSLSLHPTATRFALAMLVAYVLLFATVVGRLQTLTDIQRLLRLLAIATIAMTAFGLVQYFTSNGRFFWFYEYPYANTLTDVKGSFTCRNHFANFLVLGLGPLLAWIVPRASADRHAGEHRSTSRSGRSLLSSSALLYLGLTLIVFAVLLSGSRGGILALAVAGTVTIVVYYRRELISVGYLVGLATCGMLIVGMLSVYGYDSVASRLDDFTVGSFEDLDQGGGRRKIWAANLSAIQQGGLFGSGAGSHREIYPVYLPQTLDIEFTHAENGYLQIGTENGWLGIALLACALALAGSWCWRANRRSQSHQQLILAGAITASLAASAVHSLVDFVWYIPACMSPTILLLASVLRLAQLTDPKESQARLSPTWSRPLRFATATVATLAAMWAISIGFGPGMSALHWNKFRLAAAAEREQSIKQLLENEQESVKLQQAEELTQVMIYHLRNTLALDPSSATAHSRMAGNNLRLFELRQLRSNNAMAISQIREAAIASKFASGQELREWLLRAFGENSQLLYKAQYHALTALELCPLQGEGYLYLSNLCFLQGKSHQAIHAYIDQGLSLRPYNFSVIFRVGEQLSALGRDHEALVHWQRIFRDPGIHQLRIIQVLCKVMPAAMFLETFKPDWHTIKYVWRNYRKLDVENDWQTIPRYATEIAERDCPKKPPNEAVAIWRTLSIMFHELKNLDGALFCHQKAYSIAPNSYAVRRELGRTLLKVDRYRDAEPHLRWCLTRRPEDAVLKTETIKATKLYLTQQTNFNAEPRFE